MNIIIIMLLCTKYLMIGTFLNYADTIIMYVNIKATTYPNKLYQGWFCGD